MTAEQAGGRFSRFSMPTEGPEGFERPTDAEAIEASVTRLLDGIDLFTTRTINRGRIEISLYESPRSGKSAWIKAGGEDLAYYHKDPFAAEVYEIYGVTSVAQSSISASLHREGASESVWYRLRGEVVEDDHRVSVVRAGLNLTYLS